MIGTEQSGQEKVARFSESGDPVLYDLRQPGHFSARKAIHEIIL
jgi:hypothetical protein